MIPVTGARARADAHKQLADSLEFRETILPAVDTQRARWHAASARARASARLRQPKSSTAGSPALTWAPSTTRRTNGHNRVSRRSRAHLTTRPAPRNPP